MQITHSLKQRPTPEHHILKFRGDTLTFELTVADLPEGSAWLRTNIGHGAINRQEAVAHVDHDETILNRDWFDIPMTPKGQNRFSLTLPLSEVGHFEAKCFFLPSRAIDPVWPPGNNTVINVEPAHTCCANIIYNAFVRQFGPNKTGKTEDGISQEWVRTLDEKGYTVIPPTGTFRDLIQELDFIMGELGCRIIQLLPIHPTPTTFARMGRYGSPYAALDFTSVDPALAEFDPGATPLDQFRELVDAVHRRNGRIIIDVAINHTGWGAELHETHPEWLSRDKDGRIQNPGAWGVVWEDLAQLDYTHQGLWKYAADVFITWCKRGVDGFRCDAGYMIPAAVWKYIIACVRRQFPDTIFFLEGLGGKISVTRELLNTSGFNWAYSELFQNYDRAQIQHYLPGPIDISQTEGLMVNFAETHDNLRLAAASKPYAKMRTALCALSSPNGAFGFANGVEWFATEKIVVHEAHGLNWGAAENQVSHICKLNRMLREHPAFHDGATIKLVQKGEGNCLAILRHHLPTEEKVLVLVNLDTEKGTRCSWTEEADLQDSMLFDLLTESFYDITTDGDIRFCLLEPAQVLCLTPNHTWAQTHLKPPFDLIKLPKRIEHQQLKAKVLDVVSFFKRDQDLGKFDIEGAIEQFYHDPELFCQSCSSASGQFPVTKWQWPRDLKREVMVPPDHFLLVLSASPFRAKIIEHHTVLAQEESIQRKDGIFFAVFTPLTTPHKPVSRRIKFIVYEPGKCRHEESRLLFLPFIKDVGISPVYSGERVRQTSLLHLMANGRGAMSRTGISWGEIRSRYDALLAANLDEDYPSDRWIMFSRLRAWIVYQGYSYPVNQECLNRFFYDESGAGIWAYSIPAGQGDHVDVSVAIKMPQEKNSLIISFFRHLKGKTSKRLTDAHPVRLILRPDIEDRNFHHTTKAFTGPEHEWPHQISETPNGVRFAPASNRELHLWVSSGEFIREPEWHYMVHRPLEAQRGLDPDSDLFSPGYFSILLKGGDSIRLTAGIGHFKDMSAPENDIESTPFPRPPRKHISLIRVLERALDQFVVRRKELKSVIAGYPWFLDWGRDSLIFARGLIAAEKFDAAKAVLKQFGMYEQNGTLPNMIHGENAENRDTSDAPLWFFLACSDLILHPKNKGFIDEKVNGRKIRDILLSIGQSYSTKTPNGIYMDEDSGLIFSPAHYTWMDTNHPAGTPRQGYAIEIQALWFSAVNFLSRIDTTHRAKWQRLSERIQSSINEFYFMQKEGYLSDCLHACAGEPAAKAQPDDALRPNQLLAVTFGAVTEKNRCRSIVTACECLLVPGAIRSLADQPVKRPLEILHHGQILNDPFAPYQGHYTGDEDTKRKPAYHNGTAWTWMFPSYCEAYVKAFGEKARQTALSLLGSSQQLIRKGCVGQVPEIVDGDYPHTQRGCDAQAWGCSELYRVLKKFL